MNRKNELYFKSRRNPKSKDLKTQYVNFKKRLSNLIKKAKNEYLPKCIRRYHSESSALWKFVNQTCHASKPGRNNEIVIKDDEGNLINDEEGRKYFR